MPSSTPFDKAYAELNPQQKLAVDTIDGPVMVIAGPGTGKTQVLATRIANILLQTDTNPSAILALTFTESAAKNMRQRLVQLIGPTAYSVHVQTFHSFCDEVIRSCPEYFPVRQESEVLSDLERYQILEELLRTLPLTALKTINSPFHFLKPIMKAISDLKREGVNEEKFAELVSQQEAEFETEKADLKKTELSLRQKNITKQKELATLYAGYQTQLREHRRYDYDDMIAFVATAFGQEESLLLEYQEKLTYFLVDEYQDTNASQNKVVDLLASYWGEQANIFVVGDPHQSIYRFQGASLENTLNFIHRYPSANVITLEIGYRCPQVIYDTAAEVIAHNQTQLSLKQIKEALNKPLMSQKKTSELIDVYAAPSAPLETIFIAENIQKLMKDGVKPNEIAVLYRNNADAIDVETALNKWQVPYMVDGGNDALRSEEIQQLLTLCTVIFNLRSSAESHELFEVLNFSWLKLDPHLTMKITRAAGKSHMSIYDRVRAGYIEFVKQPFCDNVTPLEFSVFENFIEKLVTWGKQDAEITFPEWLEKMMNESGYLEWILAHPNKLTLLQQLNALFREVKHLALHDHALNLERFLEIMNTMQAHGIGIGVEIAQVHEGAVALSTTHKAKGREWEYVFLMNCVDGKWGNGRQVNLLPLPDGILQSQLQEQDPNEDDRRLFYVAITRAKKHVTISYPEVTVSGSKTKETLGSMFIEEISPAHKKNLEDPPSQQKAEEFLARLVTTAPARSVTQMEKDWLKAVISDFQLSVTALNRYLRSPQEFLEQDILKVPAAKPAYFAFGSAVHFALEQYFNMLLKEGKKPDLGFVLDKYQQALRREVLSDQEFALRLQHGKEVLTAYLHHYADEKVSPFMIERFFGSGWGKTMLGDISLVGRIDRIDWVDQSKKTARVIDYKTGRARTVNEIQGLVNTTEFSEREIVLPEAVRGPLKRQLLFYKLLTELDKSFTGIVTEGVFEFIEPDRDGKFTRRAFTLLDEDVSALKVLIQEVMKEIRELAFYV